VAFGRKKDKESQSGRSLQGYMDYIHQQAKDDERTFIIMTLANKSDKELKVFLKEKDISFNSMDLSIFKTFVEYTGSGIILTHPDLQLLEPLVSDIARKRFNIPPRAEMTLAQYVEQSGVNLAKDTTDDKKNRGMSCLNCGDSFTFHEGHTLVDPMTNGVYTGLVMCGECGSMFLAEETAEGYRLKEDVTDKKGTYLQQKYL